MADHESSKTCVLWLENRAAEVRRIEKEALDALGRDEITVYRAAMRRKAELLAALPKDALPALASLAPELRDEVRERLLRFAQSAANALSLNSVFYMSALLYPEDYRDGEPNDLEVFLQELRMRIPEENA